MEQYIPAFPVHPEVRDDEPHAGMTLRDYFAGQALSGLCASHDRDGNWGAPIDEAATQAYRHADAMMAARKGGA